VRGICFKSRGLNELTTWKTKNKLLINGLKIMDGISIIIMIQDLLSYLVHHGNPPKPYSTELTQLKAENERLKEQIELQKVNYINLSIQLHKTTNP
jgi:hypothetical protein